MKWLILTPHTSYIKIITIVGNENLVYYELETINKTTDAIIDPNYELPNISHQNLSLKNIIGEGMLRTKSSKPLKLHCFHCVGQFGVVYHAEVLTQTGEKRNMAAKTLKGIICMMNQPSIILSV